MLVSVLIAWGFAVLPDEKRELIFALA